MLLMFLYAFGHYAGIDRVFVAPKSFWEKSWTLLQTPQGECFLILWNKVAFPERYTRVFDKIPAKITKKHTITTKTMDHIHRMVAHRYTTYKKVIPLFLPHGITTYFHLLTKKSTGKKPSHSPFLYQNFELIQQWQKKDWQQLIVFPNVWTMRMLCPKSFFTSQKPSNVVLIHAKLTDRQKIVLQQKIRCGLVDTVCTTPWEIFQDRKKLTHLQLVDEHKRYYSNQQDPRYKVPVVIEWMKKKYRIV